MDKSKKVLVIQPYLAPYRIDVYNQLSNFFELKVLYWYHQAPEQNFNLEILKKRSLFNYEHLNNGFTIKKRVIKFDILRKIRKFKPSVIICHEYGFFTLIPILLSKWYKYKVIINTDDNQDMLNMTYGLRLLSRNYCLKRSAGFISINPHVQEQLNKGYPSIRNNSVCYPILQDEKYLVQELKSSIEISKKLFSGYNLKEKKILLFVGRLSKVKGIDLLIDAFYELVKSNNDLILVLVGEGEERTMLEERVKTRDIEKQVIFPGRTDGKNLYAWYNIGQVFILPSRFEPFGAVVNEALISGNYVIASSKVGANFLITPENGAIFENENTPSLIQAINSFIPKIKPLHQISEIKESKSSHSFDHYTHSLINFISDQ
ncbi:MAG: glycosyltransferase [Bacteroidota bacterium]|nr:glycosyltransferase [Bacteroidota bacterium]